MVLLLAGEACKRHAAANQQSHDPAEAATDTLPADFLAFYKRFHDDSVYQMNHIIFPLEGMPDSATGQDSLSTRFFWQREGWKIHRRFMNPDNRFETWFNMLDDQFIEHVIVMRGTDLYMMRRFARLQGEWHLIYYRGMRPEGR